MTASPGGYISPIDFRISQQAPIVTDPRLQVILNEVYNALQQIIQCLIVDCGISQRPSPQWDTLEGVAGTIVAENSFRYYEIVTENIAYGAMCNLTGMGMRNAIGTTAGKEADAYCSSTEGVLNGNVGEFIMGHGICIRNGLVKGQNYWLDSTSGNIRTTPLTAAGQIEQYIGKAISATELLVNLSSWIQH